MRRPFIGFEIRQITEVLRKIWWHQCRPPLKEIGEPFLMQFILSQEAGCYCLRVWIPSLNSIYTGFKEDFPPSDPCLASSSAAEVACDGRSCQGKGHLPSPRSGSWEAYSTGTHSSNPKMNLSASLKMLRLTARLLRKKEHESNGTKSAKLRSTESSPTSCTRFPQRQESPYCSMYQH